MLSRHRNIEPGVEIVDVLVALSVDVVDVGFVVVSIAVVENVTNVVKVELS